MPPWIVGASYGGRNRLAATLVTTGGEEAARVIPLHTDPPRSPRTRRRPRSRGYLLTAAIVAVLLGLAATNTPAPQLTWEQGVSPQDRLNVESIISTPTGFSLLGGTGDRGGVVWSTTDGATWLSRTLPRLSSRIVFHRRGLYVVDRSEVIRIGPDGDDPTVPVAVPETIRIGNGSQRSGLMAALDGLVAQTVPGDVYWSADGREFQLVVEAARWRADSDVTPMISDVTAVARERVRSICRPRARRAPDVPTIIEAEDRLVALIPQDDPSVVWPTCEPVLWQSLDGSAWVPLTDESPFPDGAHVYDAAWREGRFVAVGGIGFDNAIAWTSLDGRSWVRVERLVPEGRVDLTDVEAGPIGWVITGEPRDGSGPIGWFSEDGTCWERLPDGVAGDGIAVGDDHVVFAQDDPAAIWVGTPTDPLLPMRRCT